MLRKLSAGPEKQYRELKAQSLDLSPTVQSFESHTEKFGP